ncbi:hypothetical protein MMC25_007987 [Agyrium rufum]|nr:hypothetical protein [Agyrium rufum]
MVICKTMRRRISDDSISNPSIRIYPIMLVSFLAQEHFRFLQAYFDVKTRRLNICCTETMVFDAANERCVNTLLRWTASSAGGNVRPPWGGKQVLAVNPNACTTPRKTESKSKDEAQACNDENSEPTLCL